MKRKYTSNILAQTTLSNAQLNLVSVDIQNATAGTCVQSHFYIQHELSLY